MRTTFAPERKQAEGIYKILGSQDRYTSRDVFFIIRITGDIIYTNKITKEIKRKENWIDNVKLFVHNYKGYVIGGIIDYHKKNHPKWISLYFCFKQMDPVMIDIFHHMISYYIDYVGY